MSELETIATALSVWTGMYAFSNALISVISYRKGADMDSIIGKRTYSLKEITTDNNPPKNLLITAFYPGLDIGRRAHLLMHDDINSYEP